MEMHLDVQVLLNDEKDASNLFKCVANFPDGLWGLVERRCSLMTF